MTKYKDVDLEAYGDWLLIQTTCMADLEEKVAAVTATDHPGDHTFVESKRFPHTCRKCGWIQPEVEVDFDPDKSLRDYVKDMPRMIDEAITEAANAISILDLLPHLPSHIVRPGSKIEVILVFPHRPGNDLPH